MSRGRRHAVAVALLVCGLSLDASDAARAQALVSPVFATGEEPDANVDSCAVWSAPAGMPERLDGHSPLLFITEKDGDRIEIWNAASGERHAERPYLGGAQDSTAPGEFDRPNGVWVIYHVPTSDGFADILLVTDQTNQRVQVFRLPELEYFGEFGNGEVGKGYGISWYHDGSDVFVVISDQIPPSGFPGKIKVYRLRPEDGRLGAELVRAFGSSSGTPPLSNVESILADAFHDRLHVCGDEGGDWIALFRLDGTFTGTTYGDPEFEFDQEGINLYETGPGSGYLVVSDQYRTSTNQFEIFDRMTLASRGNFESAPGGLVTENTDGAYLEQRPLPGLPNGAFYAVNDDRNLHAYDWTDIAAGLDLDIVALDRPFASRVAADAEERARARPLLWFADASWWGLLTAASGLAIARLEDGTFAAQMSAPGKLPVAVAAGDGDLWALVGAGSDATSALTAHAFDYVASLRRYEPRGEAAPAGPARGPLADLLRESGAAGSERAWVAWVEDGEVRVTWSEGDLAEWATESVVLGSATPELPRLARLGAATALVWVDASSVSLRLHADGDAPGVWSPREDVLAGAGHDVAVTSLPDGSLVAAITVAEGVRLRRRGPDGLWSDGPLVAGASSPALVADPSLERLHMAFAREETDGRRLVRHREAPVASFELGDERLLVAWPGVDMGELGYGRELPDAARDVVVVVTGSDALGYVGRVPRPGIADASAPITMQHDPAPGAQALGTAPVVSFRIVDDASGVDRASLRLLIDGEEVSPRVRGVARNLLVSYDVPEAEATTIHVRIEAADRSPTPRVMTPFEYEFTTGASGAPLFLRGDCNDDGELDVSDPVFTLIWLFVGGAAPGCVAATDTNGDGAANLVDATRLLDYLFRNGPAPVAPFPTCGRGTLPADAVDCKIPPRSCAE